MKLSEAIREGSRRWRDNRHGFVFSDGSCCAIGAAAQMAGIGSALAHEARRRSSPDQLLATVDYHEAWKAELVARFPILLRMAQIPEQWTLFKLAGLQGSIWNIISMAHHSGKASREALAEYVESIEREAEAEAQEAPAPVLEPVGEAVGVS